MSDVLFDTSVTVTHLRKRTDILSRAGMGNAIFITTVVLGELLQGSRKGGASQRERENLDKLLSHIPVLHADETTADFYGQIAANLERRGVMIPTNDIWIAAVAMECGLPVATQDAHFERVEGLEVWLWK